MVLERTPEKGGLVFWVNNLQQGVLSGKEVANGFFNSDEFINKNVSNTKYVTLLYNTFLGRTPDSEGYNNWVTKLDNGSSRNELLEGFINSDEFQRLCDEYGINSGSGT